MPLRAAHARRSASSRIRFRVRSSWAMWIAQSVVSPTHGWPGRVVTRSRSFTDHERNFSDYFLYIHVINIESRGQTGHHGTLWRIKVGHGT